MASNKKHFKQSKKSTGLLFEDPDLPLNSKACRICGIMKHYSKFPKRQDTFDKLDTRCKPCLSEMKKETRIAQKNAPPKPIDNLCECCRKFTVKWCGDHDHKTKQFRGWLCEGCNQSIGKLGDTKEAIQKALDYFDLVEKRQKEKLKNNLYIIENNENGENSNSLH